MMEKPAEKVKNKRGAEAADASGKLAETRSSSRRDFLKFFCACGALSVLGEGCAEPFSLTASFNKHFNYHDYEQFSDADYAESRERDKTPVKAAQVTSLLSNSFKTSCSYDIDPNDLFLISDENGAIRCRLKLSPADGSVQKLIDRYPGVTGVDFSLQNTTKKIFSIKGQKGRMDITLTDSQLLIKDSGTGNNLSLYFDSSNLPEGRFLNDFNRQIAASIDYKNYQRTVHINSSDPENKKKSQTVCPDGGILEAADGDIDVFNDDGKNTFAVHDTPSFIRFLKAGKSNAAIDIFLNSPDGLDPLKHFAESMTDIGDLIEIFRLLPRNRDVYRSFINAVLGYHTRDKTQEDEYRHPIDTLRSGWADCDDYVVIHALWAHLHKYKPNLVQLEKSGSPYHVLVWYADENGGVVIMDNGNVRALDPDETLESHLKKNYPDMKVTFNEPV